eukprot:3747521-Lingulodinium_polyedra.AAC.1
MWSAVPPSTKDAKSSVSLYASRTACAASGVSRSPSVWASYKNCILDDHSMASVLASLQPNSSLKFVVCWYPWMRHHSWAGPPRTT